MEDYIKPVPPGVPLTERTVFVFYLEQGQLACRAEGHCDPVDIMPATEEVPFAVRYHRRKEYTGPLAWYGNHSVAFLGVSQEWVKHLLTTSPEVTVCCLGETANVGWIPDSSCVNWIPADELPYARQVAVAHRSWSGYRAYVSKCKEKV